VLQQVAKRLEHIAREGDHCARFGGDEFILLLEKIQHPSLLEDICSRITQALSDPIKLPCGAMVHVGISIGVSLSHADNATLAQLLKEADRQMYVDKSKRCSPYRYFSTGC
jgi:diguanylate cyclase (GGDEF)-like protein